MEYIKGTSDFFGLNHYSSEMIQDRAEFPIGNPSFEKDTGVHAFQDATWPGTIAPWLKVVFSKQFVCFIVLLMLLKYFFYILE